MFRIRVPFFDIQFFNSFFFQSNVFTTDVAAYLKYQSERAKIDCGPAVRLSRCITACNEIAVMSIT